MKPLTLTIYPLDPSFPRGYVLPRDTRITYAAANRASARKHLTDTELAAEYHQQAAYTTYWEHRTTAAHTATNQDRLETLRRFATLPHAGDEQ